MIVISCERWSSALDEISFLLTALARDASVVCRCLPCQCEEWRYHVCFVRYWDSKRNWNQQSSSSPKTPISNPGDGIADKSISTSNIQNSESCSANFFFPLQPTGVWRETFVVREWLYDNTHFTISENCLIKTQNYLFITCLIVDCWCFSFIRHYFFLSHCFDYTWCYPNQYRAS